MSGGAAALAAQGMGIKGARYGFAAVFPLLLLATFPGYALHGHQHLQRQVLGSALAQFPSSAIRSPRSPAPSTAASPACS